MWWKWVLFVFCALAAIACLVDTTISWIKGKTGPLGPKPGDWWGCGLFTLVLLGAIYWLGKAIFVS